jgi:hypothetical protein
VGGSIYSCVSAPASVPRLSPLHKLLSHNLRAHGSSPGRQRRMGASGVGWGGGSSGEENVNVRQRWVAGGGKVGVPVKLLLHLLEATTLHLTERTKAG